MFSVTVDDKEYEVKFHHFNPAGDRVNYDYPGTYCWIKGYVSGELIHEVCRCTYLHPLDRNSYKKNFGRKESMTRALRQAFPGEDNKETRRKFWQAYYEARGKKW